MAPILQILTFISAVDLQKNMFVTFTTNSEIQNKTLQIKFWRVNSLTQKITARTHQFTLEKR